MFSFFSLFRSDRSIASLFVIAMVIMLLGGTFRPMARMVRARHLYRVTTKLLKNMERPPLDPNHFRHIHRYPHLQQMYRENLWQSYIEHTEQPEVRAILDQWTAPFFGQNSNIEQCTATLDAIIRQIETPFENRLGQIKSLNDRITHAFMHCQANAKEAWAELWALTKLLHVHLVLQNKPHQKSIIVGKIVKTGQEIPAFGKAWKRVLQYKVGQAQHADLLEAQDVECTT